MPSTIAALEEVLRGIGPVAVAVSGGVDSMTLAVVAHRSLGDDAEMLHATSAAVPPEATARVERYAAANGWRLRLVDAGEFDDSAYLANPADRCYFCKRDLYGTIAAHTEATIVSGTNVDDLDDIRPGLRAASERAVRHPFVDAGITKSAIREIAAELGLDDLAALPAAPCLSSRVETGIAIDANTLTAIHAVESFVTDSLTPETVRCRVRATGVVVELDDATFESLSESQRSRLQADTAAVWRAAGFDDDVRIDRYRRGSAFLRLLP